MANKAPAPKSPEKVDAAAAATLAGVIYQAKLLNRQAKINVPEQDVVAEVINLWRTVMDALA
jgi:hypothetical protein